MIVKLFATQSIYISISVVNYIFTDSRKLREIRFAYFSSYRVKKNVPWQILAPAAVACDIYLIRRSAHPRRAFLLYRKAISCKVKKTVSELSVLSLSYVSYFFYFLSLMQLFYDLILQSKHLLIILRCIRRIPD